MKEKPCAAPSTHSRKNMLASVVPASLTTFSSYRDAMTKRELHAEGLVISGQVFSPSFPGPHWQNHE
jgi:hypothetical protein